MNKHPVNGTARVVNTRTEVLQNKYINQNENTNVIKINMKEPENDEVKRDRWMIILIDKLIDVAHGGVTTKK